MKKIIILHNIISPIRVHLFNELNSFYKEKNIKFKVIFLSESDKNRHWKNFNIEFDYEILENIAIRVGRKDLFTFFINKNILKILNRENPDKIISFGWDHWACYAGNYWAKKNNKAFILWSGSTKYEKSWRRTVFSPLVKHIIKTTSRFIAYGTRAKEYLISLGADPNQIEIFYNTVDVEKFENQSRNFSEEEKKSLKQQLQIMTSNVILFNGQIIERKGIFDLIKAFHIYTKEQKNISLLILGKGKEKNRLLDEIKKKNIQNVFFADFVQYDDVYKYYSISNLFVLPSHEEVWGLVINEALACGLPVITTEETGASIDLIKDGKNGYIIKSEQPEMLLKAIREVFNKNLDKVNNSQEMAEKFIVSDMINKSHHLS